MTGRPQVTRVTDAMIAAALAAQLGLTGRHPLGTFSADLVRGMRAALHAALAAATPASTEK